MSKLGKSSETINLIDAAAATMNGRPQVGGLAMSAFAFGQGSVLLM
jgi:hypothetical protein